MGTPECYSIVITLEKGVNRRLGTSDVSLTVDYEAVRRPRRRFARPQ